jgi:hypothetical protein
MFRTASRVLFLSGMLALRASRAGADEAPTDRSSDGHAHADRGERKSDAVKRERRKDDPDDADDGLQKKSKAGEKRAEPDP